MRSLFFCCIMIAGLGLSSPRLGTRVRPICRPTQIFGLHLPLWIRHNRLCYRSGMRDRRRTLRTFLPSTIRLVAPHSLSAIHDRLRQIRRVREDEASLLQEL